MNRRRPAPEQLALLLDIPVAPQQREDVRPRQLRIEHEVFTFRLRRARRRSIGFQIDDRGLTVSAPRWVPLREIEAAIVEKRRWIVTKQREWHEWCSRRRLPVLRFVDGDRLPYLGSHLVLRTDADAVATHLQEQELRLALPRGAGAGMVAGRSAPRLCRTDRALRPSHQQPLFRLESFIGAFAMGIVHARRAPAVSWRLIDFSLPIIDYVVAHELAHLDEMNHSARFWRSVAQLLPGFEAARDEIRGVDMTSLPL